MAITADQERRLLNKYNLSTLDPDRWPHEDDESSEDEDEDEQATAKPVRQQSKLSMGSRSSLNKYKSIDRHASIRSAGSLGPDSVVQKDEPDPLGTVPSVTTALRRKGLPVEDDVRLRNRFMLSSTTFSPALFLSQVHQDASTEDLLRGLEYLGRSIEQKSASLKVLVESNFERFVRAKAVIDNVYTEMRNQGADSADLQPSPALDGRRSYTRRTSRSQTHFRNTSGPFSSAAKLPTNEKKKNALTKESEYGVLGIKAPLQDLTIKAEEVWGPALGGREKEETVKSVLTALEQHRDIFRINGAMREAVQKHDYDTVIEEWRKANRHANQAREIADVAKQNDVSLGEQDAQQIIVTAKMWHDVSQQVDAFKRDIWKRLKNSHARKPAAVADETDKEEHMELIGVLLQLGVDENPISQWLTSRHAYLKDRIARSFERSRIEIEILRRRLAANDRHDMKILAGYLRSAVDASQASLSKPRDSAKDTDMPDIIAFWERVQACFTGLLSPQHGVLGEVVEFWETAQSFINNKAQKSFPTAVFAAGLEHLELEPDDVSSLREGAVELVNLLRENVMSFFADAPVEDLSELYSPIPPTPITPDSANSGAFSPVKRSFTLDPNNVPPPSPKRGDAWEKFAFWAPHANSLSGSYYLSRVLAVVGTAASQMAGLSVIRQSQGSGETFKTLVSSVRERCVQAVCAAWVADAERCKYLEDWVRSAERRDITCFPANFSAFQETVLGQFQRIAYISEEGSTPSQDIITPPPAKLLQAVRGSFVTSLYKTLSGMVENAEKGMKFGDRASEADPDGVTLAAKGSVDGEAGEGKVDESDKNIRMLMTLSNLSYLRTDTIPHLISQFESSFSVKLTDESKTIRDVLGQIDARLFQSYVKPTVDALSQTITAGITSEAWVPKTARPTDARSYVYDVLLTLVLVHSEVSTTAAGLTNQILSYLLEQSSLAFLQAFKSRRAYSLAALMQATLDVEFMAQTLNNYTTDRAGEVQSQIYLALDERTDDEARKRLQGELPEMRAILKKLREGTKGEFGCFKRERRGRAERVSAGGGSAGGSARA